MTSLMTTRAALPTTVVAALASCARSPRGRRALRAAVSIAAEIGSEILHDPAARARLGVLVGIVPDRAPQPPTEAAGPWDAVRDVARRGRGDVAQRWAGRPAQGDCEGWRAHRRARG